jgi:peptide/nickel transport system substrate-binding protein
VAAWLAVALVVGLGAAPAAGEGRPRYGGAVEAALLGAPATLDPALAQSHAELTVATLVFDTLYQLAPDGSARPHLAAGPPALDERQLVARITIRHGVRFHDGSEVTAADVAASLERLRGTPARWLVATVTKLRIDGDVVELTLRSPLPALATLLALPQASVTRGGHAPGEHPIGSGPFAIERLDRAKRQLTLRAFDDHFAGRPYLDQLALRWYDTADGEARRFETGAAQLSVRGVAAFAGAQPTYKAEVREGPAALLVYVGFGKRHAEITGERAFRAALDLALARGGLANIGVGERVVPTRSPIPVEAGGVALDAAGRDGDPDGARAALVAAAAKAPALAAGQLAATPLELLVEDTRPDDREIAERVVRALDRLGVTATIAAVPAVTLRERVARGTVDLWIGQLASPLAVGAAWWAAAFAEGGDDATAARVVDGRLGGAAAARGFAERLPVVPLLFRAVRAWHRSDLRGVGFDGLGRLAFADVFLYGEPSRVKKGAP